MPTDAELRDAAVVNLKQTTVGYKNKHWKTPTCRIELGAGARPARPDRGFRTSDPEPPLPVGPRLWADNSPINTPIGANPSVVLGYGQGPLNGLPGIGFNGGGWGVAIFRDSSGSRRTVSNSDGWKLDNVPAPSQYAAYVNAMAALGDTERHSVIFDRDRAHNIYGANPGLTTALAMGELRPAGSGFWDNLPGPWLGRASGFCSAAGAVLKSELEAGDVPHALALGWPKERISRAVLDDTQHVRGSRDLLGRFGRNRRGEDGLKAATRPFAHRRTDTGVRDLRLLPPRREGHAALWSLCR